MSPKPNAGSPRDPWPDDLAPETAAEQARLDRAMGLLTPSHSARLTAGGSKLVLGGVARSPVAPPPPTAAQSERHRLLAARPDFDPEFRRALMDAPLREVRHYVKSLPRRPLPKAGTLPAGPREPAGLAAYLDHAMGLATSASSQSSEHKLVLGGGARR